MTPAGHCVFGVFVFMEWERGLGMFYYTEMMTIRGDGCAHSDLNTA